MTGITYGELDLQAGGITVHRTDVHSAPTNEVQAEELAESDGAIIVKQRYASKRFTIEGTLRTATTAETDSLIDNFKIAMSKKNQNFDIEHAGGLRRFLATAQNIVISRPTGATLAGFSVEFISPDGMGWDLDSSSLLEFTSIASATASLAVTVGGSYKAEPLITVTVNTVTGATAKSVTISNDETLRGIVITRDWANGDVVEIDSYKKTLFVNDVPADFTGQFPTWDAGAGVIGYIDDFTTRDVSIRADYTRRWL